MFFLTLKLVRFFVKLVVKLVALPFRILKALVGVAGGGGTDEAPNEPVGGEPPRPGREPVAEPPPESEYAAPPPDPQDGAPPPEPRDAGPPPEPRDGAPRADPPREGPPPEPRQGEPPHEAPSPEPRGGEPPATPRNEPPAAPRNEPPVEPQDEPPRQDPQSGAPRAEPRDGPPSDPDAQAGQRPAEGDPGRAEADPGDPGAEPGTDLRPDSADLDLDAMRPSEIPVTAADGRVVSHLVERLDSDDATVRREAVTKLGEIGAEQPSLVDPVTDAIERCRLDPDREVVDAAAAALDGLPDDSGRSG
jgi:PAS domain-containing protein